MAPRQRKPAPVLDLEPEPPAELEVAPDIERVITEPGVFNAAVRLASDE